MFVVFVSKNQCKFLVQVPFFINHEHARPIKDAILLYDVLHHYYVTIVFGIYNGARPSAKIWR